MDERDVLMQVSRDWAALVAAGNLDAALDFWTDDAIVMPPDQPAVAGKAAIRAFVHGAMSTPGFSITWEPERAVLTGPDAGYLIERNRVTVADEHGALQTQHGKALTIWRRQSDGRWKCVAECWNSNPTARVLG